MLETASRASEHEAAGCEPDGRVRRRRFALNPCDYLYYAHDRLMVARGQIGNVTLMLMDVEGEIDPARVRAALRRMYCEHPVAAARVRTSLVSGRPRWVLPKAPASLADSAYCYDDLSGASDWLGEMWRRCERRYAEPCDLHAGPLTRIDYYAGPNGQGRVCLRWPHALMDAEGAQWFLAELARMDRAPGPAALPAALRPDGMGLDPLGGASFGTRFRLFRKAFRVHRDYGKVQRVRLDSAPPEPSRALGLRLRVFEADEVERIQSNAKAKCPAGKGIYARYLAGCVIRALHRLYLARGLETESYLVTLPQSVRPAGPRPVHGNYLVAATLCGRRALIEDSHMFGADLKAQLERFESEGMAEANWALIWMAGLMRTWQYRILLGLPIGLEPYASGFSYYGEIDPPIREFCGARVTNLWGATPLSAPPGWNPAFSRFDRRLNFTLTWIRGYVSDALAEEFARTIEQEALEPQSR
ncbi:MAG: hypothetical protein L6Q92_11975 [Phycisphaerae bacterium]|nr:hypothetical protein [Phycisphaerae bacterium]